MCNSNVVRGCRTSGEFLSYKFDQESGDGKPVYLFSVQHETPGTVYRVSAVVRKEVKRAMKRRERKNGKTKNKNQT